MVRRLALWMCCPRRHHNSQQMAPKRKYCTHQAAIRSLNVMMMCLFQECMLTHSCNANNIPNNVNAPTKMTGFRNGSAVRSFTFGNKFSGGPYAFCANCTAKLFKNWKEEAIDLQTIHRGRTPSQPPEIRPWCLLYRRKQAQESDAQTMYSP